MHFKCFKYTYFPYCLLIRQQRLQEWKCLQRRQKYGELREISGEQYVKEVTNAPEDVWVIIHLYRPR